jgi:hypothetical protein
MERHVKLCFLFWGTRVASLPSEMPVFFPIRCTQGQNDKRKQRATTKATARQQ